MPFGLYISVPFCRTKCSYCNFASDVFSRAVFARYVDRLCTDIAAAEQTAVEAGGEFERGVDTIYLGGGTPTMLEASDLQRLFSAIRERFDVHQEAEITIECAPGTLNGAVLETLVRGGVNRVSLGVQSFVDGEASAVGRLHTRQVALEDIGRLRAAGISNLNVDLIAGLPHQTAESWRRSLEETIATGVPHASVYMLEVDEDSRLGRELIAGGTRYHAHFVPDEDATADFYLETCERLNGAGVQQYEISNFARAGWESRHNLKYWTRQPYLGFGVDAHSMLDASSDPYLMRRNAPRASGAGERPCALGEADFQAVRFATPDSLEVYMTGAPLTVTPVSGAAALEESFFLGLRLTRGVDLRQLAAEFGCDVRSRFANPITELCSAGLLEISGDRLRLTARGRLLSNEVFQQFLCDGDAKGATIAAGAQRRAPGAKSRG